MGEQFVSQEKRQELERRMIRLGVGEHRLIEKFITGSGSGGQKINKTASCVYLRDPVSGIEIKCQRTRSRELNRHLARRDLCERLEERLQGLASARQQAREQIRRQKRRRSRRQREKLLDAKHHHAGIKSMRRSPGGDD